MVPIDMLRGHGNLIWSLETTHNGDTLISGSTDRTIKIWDISNRTLLFTLKGHGTRVNTLAVTQNDSHLISGDKYGNIKVWSLNDY